MRISFSLLLSVIFLGGGLPTQAADREMLDSELLDFELEDQFKNIHRRSDVRGTIVVLIGSDKGGSRFNGLWSNAIQESLSHHPRYDQVSQLAYADLSGLPFFLKGLVRGKFPQDPERWVLMDWKGIVAKTYEFAPKSSNVLLFSPDGTLVHHASGREPDEATLQELVTALLELLDQVAPTP